MKKRVLLIALLIVSAYGFSQNALYGVRAGINASNLDFDPDPNFQNVHRNGFAIGFFAEFDLSTSVALAPELQYSSEGAKS